MSLKRIIAIIAVLLLLVVGVVGIQCVQLQIKDVQARSEQATGVDSDGDIDEFDSQLPVVSIDADGAEIKKESVVWSTLSVFDADGGGNSPSDTPAMTTAATVKYRGNSSYSQFDKRSYRVKFFSKAQSDKENPEPFLGMAEDSEWVLNGPFLDRSLVRQRVMYGISRDLMDWAPDTRFCELYVDGEYQGVYLAIEPVTNGPERLGMTRFGLVSGETAYLVHRDRIGTDPGQFDTWGIEMGYTSLPFSLDYPAQKNVTEAQIKWVASDLDSFEKVLYGDLFDDPTKGYAAQIDVDNFVDYFLLNEFSLNADAGWLSTYVYRNLNGKMRMCVWDYNNTFDNYMGYSVPYDEFLMTNTNWFDRLLTDRAFVEKVVARWRELRAGELSDDALCARVDGNVAELGDAVDRNFEVWGYTFDNSLLHSGSSGEERDPTSYDEAVLQLKDTMLKRAAWMDDHIEDLYGRCIN